MNTILKRVISMVLCFVLVAGYLPVGTFATEAVETVPAETTAVTEETIQVLSEDAEEPSESTETTEDDSEITEPSTEATVPENTEETVPETTEETVPETTEETVPETTEETVPETTEETVPETTEAVILEEEVTEEVTSEAMLANIEGVVDAAIFFSDLHTSNGNYKQSTVKDIMDGLQNTGLPFSSVTSCGDAFSVNADNTKYTGKTSTITGYIRNVFAGIPVNYVWSDHDRYALQQDDKTLLDKTSKLVYGAGNDGVYGTDDDGNYYVYSLSMGDLCSYDRYSAGFNYTTASNSRASKGFTATVPEAIAKFGADVANLKKDRPLFIASHQPLFDNRNDNAWAEDWFDAINEVAEDMDVAYFYGHNHKYDSGSDYYYAKGTQMPVATDGGWNFNYEVGVGYKPSVNLSSVSKTLNFTHMCAGYLAPSSTGSTSSTTREGTAVAVTILEDSISYVTYNSKGVYTGSYALNETVKRDHAGTQTETPDPSEPTVPSAPESTEVTVGDVTATISGATITASGAVSDADKALLEAKGYAGFVAMDVTATVDGESATVTFPIPDGWNPARVVGISVKDGAVEEIPGTAADGKFTFSVTHFSTTGIALTAADDVTLDPTKWVPVVAPSGGTISAYAYKQATSITGGQKYVIVGKDHAFALMDNNGSMGGQNVTISGNTMTSTTELTEWTFSDTNSGTIKNGKNGIAYYNRFSLYEERYATNLTFTQNDSNFRIQSGNYSLYYNGSSWTRSGNRVAEYVRLYQRDADNDVTTGGSGAVYGQLVGPTEYQVLLGTSAEDALQAVKDSMTVYTTTDNTSPNGIAVNDNDKLMSWSMANYDPDKADTYTVTISYNGKELGTATVEVTARIARSVTLDRYEGIVERDSVADTATGAYLSVTWNDNTTEQIPVSVAMLSGNYNVTKNGTYSGLTVSYAGQTFENFTLKVVNKSGVNDFPVYPNPGSIELKKSANGVNFQNTGIARVELSASGLPLSGAGVDVIVMLDTSSSMDRCVQCGEYTGKDSGKGDSCSHTNPTNRIDELKVALQTLEDTLKESNNAANIRVAVADFNGVVSGATALDTKDRTVDASALNSTATKQVYTGSKALNAGAFVPATQLDVSTFTIKGYTGTNYDYAFDAIYQLGTAIKTANGANQRALYVIFMSDGAPNQFNYYGTTGGGTGTTHDWNIWLQGLVGKDYVDPDGTTHRESMSQVVSCSTHSYYYDDVDHDGDGFVNEHRMANAIKGDPKKTYKVIRKATGLGTATDQSNIYEVPGLGATMYSLAFYVTNDGNITEASAKHALTQIASQDPQNSTQKLYVDATSGIELEEAFKDIAGKIANAAENARFVDQMGDSFNLQLDPTITTNAGGSVGTTTTNTDITITSHPVYTKEQINTTVSGHTVTASDVGKPYGNGTTLETVKFAVNNGTITATTSVGGYTIPDGNGSTTTVTANSTNILVGGVIYGKNFFYNNNNAAVTVTLANGSTYSLPGETFYWNIGTIKETQYTISYTVYLEGSMDGHRESGSYDTNNFATLYYTNHVGNEVNKSVGSPSLAWKGANVSYAFYLVKPDGTPAYADGTAAPNFLQAYKITQPVVYESQLLLNDAPVTLTAAALAVLPDGYELYAPAASYTVAVGSGDGQGANRSHWIITGDDDLTTYVMGYGGANDYSSAQEVYDETYDYTHTTVYFAVKWVVGAVQDTVVVDYGLPVDINVMANDMFGSDGTLAAVGKRANKPEGHGTPLATGFGTSVTGSFGNAVVKDGKVRYTLSSMQMKDAEKLAYAVNYAGAANPGYYYGDLTIIPATTIYYEDEFVALKTYTRPNADAEYSWKTGWPVNSVTANGTQAEDRPGSINLGTIDANNIYGYDQAYDQMSTHSMGNSAMIHVDANQYGTAEFSFWGTGFDVVSVTSNKTGTLVVQVYDANNQLVELNDQKLSHAVDTFFGYTLNENGEWVVTEHTPNALYQVPVMQYAGLPYGKYNVKISALYYPTFDATTDAGYDLYLDAIRIYDPAGAGDQTVSSNGDKNTTINDIYAQDGEAWPSYHELRNLIIAAEQVEGADGEIEGIVFIDGVGDTNAISDYTSYGPNNELYLASGQSVAFNMNLGNNTDHEGYVPVVRIGLKTVGGKTAVAEMWNAKVDSNDVVSRYNAISDTLQTATDMYYDITVLNKNTVVIHNSGEAGSILSITNIKLTYKPDTLSIPENTEGGDNTGDDNTGDDTTGQDQQTKLKFSVSKSVANAALMSLAPVQEEIPEPSVPESSEPEENKPTEPVKPGKTDLKKAVDAAKKLKEKDYTKDSFQAVKSALKVAEKVLKNKKASQTQIEAAFEALESAVENLEVKPDNTGLKKAVDKAKKLKEKDYTKDSFKNFKNALKAAEKVLKNKNATQAEIDEALTELNESMSDLAKKSSGKKPGKR